MPPIRCFMVEETGRRRYTTSIHASGDERCGGTGGRMGHHVRVFGEPFPGDEAVDWSLAPTIDYPAACGCGYELLPTNSWRSSGTQHEYIRPDTGETAWEPGGFGPGAMYFSRGPHCCFPHDPPCAEHLHVVLPNGHEWDIDSRANNCGLKDDKVHHCWERSGVAPDITVRRGVPVCGAGGGSILAGDYHGFLGGGPEGPGWLVDA